MKQNYKILVSETMYEVTVKHLEQKHANFKQNLEKRHDKKWRKFQQNPIKSDKLGCLTQIQVIEKQVSWSPF